jgi:hypothetical protein
MGYPRSTAFDKRQRRKGNGALDLTGLRFGHLRVLTYAGYRQSTQSILWLCHCDCGERKVVRTSHLRHGIITNCCDCGHRQVHGQSDTPAYQSWQGMRQRCRNPKATQYAAYGGRGIKVCDRWLHSFKNFLADMGKRPAGKTLDRINVDGNYEPGNCRWATQTVQANNRRSSKKYKAEHATTPEAEAASIMGVDVVM